MLFFDKKGDLKGAVPSSPEIDGIIGDNFAFRDYYIGVSKNWEPYVGAIIRPVVPLGYNIVPVAIPIKTDEGDVLGFIILHIKLETISEWVEELDLGKEISVHIVDQTGQLIARSDTLVSREIMDISSDAVVRKTLSGESGVGVMTDEIGLGSNLVAYTHIEKYNWGVIIKQPSNIAFAERNSAAIFFGLLWLLATIIISCCIRLVVKDRNDLKSQRDKEKMLMDSIGDGVVAIDRSFNIVSWNKAASQLSGWGAVEALGQPLQKILKFVRASDMTDDIIFIEEVMLFGEVRTMNPDTLLIRKDGSSLPVGDSASPIFDVDHSVTGAIIIFRDASKEQDIKRARELVILKTIHDLRAPATAIKLVTEEYGDVKSLKSNTKLLKESIDLIKSANTRMLALVNSLLDQASKNASQKKVDRSEIKDVVDQIIREMTPMAKRKGVSMDFDLSLPMTYISISNENLKEILSNLIDNAIKYNKNGGRVIINYSKDGDDLVMSIRDTGVGMSEDTVSKIFTPFHRFSKDIEGTGLGLSIVKKMVEDCGGQIACTSNVGVGTTFEIKFKLAK